jgi:hypothetical protein
LQLDQLEVFLHLSIHRILQISISKVQEDRIRIKRVREKFYSIPCVQNMIAARQADFIGRMIQGSPDRPSRNMITVCCDHKRQVGHPQTTGKNFMVKNLRLLFQDVNTVHINRFGLLQDWIHEASNKNTGINWLTASFTPARRCQNIQKPGDRFHCGARNEPPTIDALLITMERTTTTTTMEMTTEMTSTTEMMNHENATNPPITTTSTPPRATDKRPNPPQSI